jgi:hypothetical protein
MIGSNLHPFVYSVFISMLLVGPIPTICADLSGTCDAQSEMRALGTIGLPWACVTIVETIISGTGSTLSLSIQGATSMFSVPPTPALDLSPTQDSILRNGGFEARGLSGWIAKGSVQVVKNYSVKGYTVAKGEIIRFPDAKPHSGSWFLVLGKNEQAGTISQTVTLPPNTVQASLSFWYSCVPTTGSKLGFWLIDKSGKILRSSNLTATADWSQFRTEIGSEYYGQRLTVKFSGVGITNFITQGTDLISSDCITVLDDVYLVAQVVTPTPTPSVNSTTTPTPTETPMPTLTSPTPVPTSTTAQPSIHIPPLNLSIETFSIIIAATIPVALALVYNLRRRPKRPKKR